MTSHTLVALCMIMDQAQISKLQEQLAAKTEAEQKHLKSASQVVFIFILYLTVYCKLSKQVTAVSDQQSKELTALKANIKTLNEQNKTLQGTLDKAYDKNSKLEQELAEVGLKFAILPI